MNSEQIEKLYSIASHLKVSDDAKNSYLKLKQNNQSHSINERYNEACEEYNKALNDFNYFLQKYVIVKTDNE